MYKKFSCMMVAMLFLITCVFSGCGNKGISKSSEKPEKINLTDMDGRKVTIPANIRRVVAIGLAMRLYCYVNGINELVGVEKAQQTSSDGRPYMLANPGLKKLPVIGPGFPADPNPELILNVKPDVIIAGDIVDKSGAEELQNKTGIPVVNLTCGNNVVFDQKMYTALKLIGKVIGKEKRANDIVDYMENCKNDLSKRTKDISNEEKQSVYVGALSMKGTHGIESTSANYPQLEILNAKNVADETGKSGSVMIDKEKLLTWNPQKIIIDEGGYTLVQQDYGKNSNFYNSLSAVKNGELYGQLPYVAYYNNIDTALADTYYLGKVLYPEKFKDINPEKKADEIYKFLLGKELYSQMAKDYGGFKKITLKQLNKFINKK
ncbi:iron ABC transporter substrate-binding protein [Clostridium ljungdahlii]|uniref:iron ABC transporter substrate-binding protein n=1 Tax=Clostridium ljungdahlii TaxID=1538 RepID=UPI0038657E36